MKELQRLMTGCEAEWKANPRLLARATEIIESLAKQLEAKGDHSEEYKRGFKDGVKNAQIMKNLFLIKCCSNCEHDSEENDYTQGECNTCKDYSNFKPKGE